MFRRERDAEELKSELESLEKDIVQDKGFMGLMHGKGPRFLAGDAALKYMLPRLGSAMLDCAKCRLDGKVKQDGRTKKLTFQHFNEELTEMGMPNLMEA